jgi:hypothetical protein
MAAQQIHLAAPALTLAAVLQAKADEVDARAKNRDTLPVARLEGAELALAVPFPATVNGEPVTVTAVLTRVAVIESSDRSRRTAKHADVHVAGDLHWRPYTAGWRRRPASPEHSSQEQRRDRAGPKPRTPHEAMAILERMWRAGSAPSGWAPLVLAAEALGVGSATLFRQARDGQLQTRAGPRGQLVELAAVRVRTRSRS